MTTALQLKREQMSLSKAELARRAGMQQGLIGWIESRRFIPYDSQLAKLAEALNWSEDPTGLLEEVEER